jgi:hypothetical protein
MTWTDKTFSSIPLKLKMLKDNKKVGKLCFAIPITWPLHLILGDDDQVICIN